MSANLGCIASGGVSAKRSLDHYYGWSGAYGAFELGLTFLMKIKTTFTVGSSVEGVSKILLAADGTDFCLLFVYFQE